jgi:PPOX class probable F420-dependent enzyme
MSSYPFPPEHILPRLENEANVWLATVRPDTRPHLVPLWFVWHEAQVYLCVQPESVKARNLHHNPHVVLSLENGNQPVICEGTAAAAPHPWPEAVRQLFQQKYDWDINTDAEYGLLLLVTPRRWLVWG